MLADTISRLEGRGVTVLLSGVQAAHARLHASRTAHTAGGTTDTPAGQNSS